MLVHVLTDMEDLLDVLEIVEGVPDWKRLGLALGLYNSPTLTNIEQHRQKDTNQCLQDMLSAWFEHKDKVRKFGVPSWSVLKSALTRIGQHKLADSIVSELYP